MTPLDDLPPRELYELALLESKATGMDDALRDMSEEMLQVGIRILIEQHGDTPRTRAVGTAWFALWRQTHPRTA